MKIITVVTAEAHQEVVVLVPLNQQRSGGGRERGETFFVHTISPESSACNDMLPLCPSPVGPAAIANSQCELFRSKNSVPCGAPLQDSQPTLGALGMRACRQPAGHQAGKGENGNEKLVGFRGGGTDGRQEKRRKRSYEAARLGQDSDTAVTREAGGHAHRASLTQPLHGRQGASALSPSRARHRTPIPRNEPTSTKMRFKLIANKGQMEMEDG